MRPQRDARRDPGGSSTGSSTAERTWDWEENAYPSLRLRITTKEGDTMRTCLLTEKLVAGRIPVFLFSALYLLISATTAGASAPIKDYGLKDYIRVSKDLPHSENEPWRLVCEMPYNCHFQPWIQAESPPGKVIRFNSSNPLVLYLTPTETYTTTSGQQTYEATNWVSGEGAIYTIPAGVTVQAVKYRETGYDTAFAGSFECNDNDYNILWKKWLLTSFL